MRIRQISVFLENRSGQLSAACRALAKADINIATLSLADTSDFGIVRLIVDDHERARQVLAENGFVANVHEVVAVCVPDRPGGMAEVTEVLDRVGANIEYSYAFSFHRGEKAVLVFRFTDPDVAEAALREAGYTVLAEEQVKDNR